MRVANGTQEVKDGVKQIAIRFPVEKFERIAKTAAERGLSFAEFVRVMVDKGLQQPEG